MPLPVMPGAVKPMLFSIHDLVGKKLGGSRKLVGEGGGGTDELPRGQACFFHYP